MKSIISFLTTIGGFAGLITLIWKITEEFRTYLLINVEVRKVENNYTIFTEVRNINKLSKKKIENAFLIISPEKCDIIKAGQRIAQDFDLDPKSITTTNCFVKFRNYSEPDIPIYKDQEIVFIPLDFYYLENLHLADEQLTYTCFVNKEFLLKGKYSVRFYLCNENRLPRSTQDLLIIN
ncbi:hypothetical protein [Mucilaginibacter sp.]|uniref:hypothetical protein n=1 Tax=Mucilaginibacter sp. TaxID=1882438 RepID=UPI003D14D2FA